MDPERWRRITEIFHAALARESATRAAFLAEVCGDDGELRSEVETLLAGDARARDGGDPFAQAAPTVAPGSTLGPYRIESALGAGGMGEVYKARDTRLNRSVAIKVLPSAFANEPELRQRFEREAQAIAALRHPHICVLYDIGHDQGIEYLVMEHLEGESLEQRLKKGPLPFDRAIQYAIEIAEALHSAHRTGITHRDLKPGNVMLTKDGAKLLDFGLAKFGARATAFASATALPTTPHTLTSEGTIVGTFQYMAPEQLEGKDADERTDLFAFGAVVYEMITGRRAFTGENRSSLIASILRDEPPAMSTLQPVTPGPLDLLVRACLAKDPDRRLQSAHDAAVQLRWIRDGAFAPAAAPTARTSWRARLPLIAAAMLVGAAVAGVFAYLAGRRAPAAQPTLTKLTFRRGTIDRARFTPDGQTVVYTARWDGKPPQTFTLRLDTGQSAPLTVPDAQLLSISRKGELAILLKSGTLATVPLGGEAPRELIDNVLDADWAADGSLAVLRGQGRDRTIEYPIGTTLFKATAGRVDHIRLSPDGNLIGFLDLEGGGGRVATLDRAGAVKHLTRRFPGVCGCLIWRGRDVWFSASESGLDMSVYAVSPDGRERAVQRSPETLGIEDGAADGRVLVMSELTRANMVGVIDGVARDLSWLDYSTTKDLSSDGTILLFGESGVGAGATPATFLRKTDGSAAIRLTEGVGLALSPDGLWVLVRKHDESFPTLVPTGAGQSRPIDIGRLELSNTFAAWLPDNDRVVFNAAEPGRPSRVYVQSLTKGAPQPITPDGVRLTVPAVVSPDSRVVTVDNAGKFFVYDTANNQPEPLEGLARGDTPVRWSADGKAVWLANSRSRPIQILRLDLATRTRAVWREIAVPDPAGFSPPRVHVSADGKHYVYGFQRTLGSLYMIDGLR